MIKNVIFDLGGVVIGRDFSKFGEKVGSIFSFFSGFNFPTCWKEFDRGTMTLEEVAKELADLNNCSVEESTAAIMHVMELMQEISETGALVRELKEKGFGVYILSNMPKEFYAQIEKLDIIKVFDGAVISYRERLIKPDPRIFGLILDRYDLEPGESLFVDDKKKNVDTALGLGMEAVHFTSPAEGVAEIRKRCGLFSHNS